MKLFSILLVMAAAGYLGYVLEPNIQHKLTGIAPKKGTIVDPVKFTDGILNPPPPINFSTIPASELPPTITLEAELKLIEESSGITTIIAPGTPAKLIRIDGENAVVRAGNQPFEIVVPISKTDLAKRMNERPATNEATVPAPKPIPKSAPAPSGDSEEPKPIPAPAEVVKPATPPAPKPAAPLDAPAAPEPAATPEPTAAPEPAASPEPAGTIDVVAVMQESIRGNQIKEFAFGQVLDWKPQGNEIVDGETFQTGTAEYKAETIFGVKNIQAKALIKGTKVVRWIWPKSGIEIK